MSRLHLGDIVQWTGKDSFHVGIDKTKLYRISHINEGENGIEYSVSNMVHEEINGAWARGAWKLIKGAKSFTTAEEALDECLFGIGDTVLVSAYHPQGHIRGMPYIIGSKTSVCIDGCFNPAYSFEGLTGTHQERYLDLLVKAEERIEMDAHTAAISKLNEHTASMSLAAAVKYGREIPTSNAVLMPPMKQPEEPEQPDEPEEEIGNPYKMGDSVRYIGFIPAKGEYHTGHERGVTYTVLETVGMAVRLNGLKALISTVDVKPYERSRDGDTTNIIEPVEISQGSEFLAALDEDEVPVSPRTGDIKGIDIKGMHIKGLEFLAKEIDARLLHMKKEKEGPKIKLVTGHTYRTKKGIWLCYDNGWVTKIHPATVVNEEMAVHANHEEWIDGEPVTEDLGPLYIQTTEINVHGLTPVYKRIDE